ncbi:histidine-containing phosphotransfer protein 1-like isoform X4 [Juglans microcarpa x Juglans regia]|uniref:histidine-containing phosphotransfer protein 1-like isoform X4 n=1 Tax=Juglans microcarpa x Juglans regia TaxID=2249226 RepID=UPI001B7DFD50|nr:histidine-containing phosphotransfer protein 1-like isoform X4 [Juglans microcarpa x Juglans regia]
MSLTSFSNCKMRATQILWWKWCLSSLRILRGFSMNWPKLFGFLLDLLLPFFNPNLLFREQKTIDFRKVDAHVHQFKGSSSSIGAHRVQKVCIAFRNYCEEQNVEGCLKCLQQVKHEYSLVRNKLETLFQLEKQIIAAGGSLPAT